MLAVVVQPVVESDDVITVDGDVIHNVVDVIHDVVVLQLASCRLAAFDVAQMSVGTVVDGVAGLSESFGDAGVEAH